MDAPSNRRRFLSLAGTGAAASIAGCSQLDLTDDGSQSDAGDGESDGGGSDGGESADGESDGGGGSNSADTTVTASVQPAEEDMAQLQQRQAQLQQQLQAGEINESEYRAEVQSLQEDQTELIDEAMTEFESYAADSDGLEIADSADGTGLFLLEASPDTLVGTLTDEAVAGLLPEPVFAEAQQSQSG